jgi:hypothetical protein
VAFIEKRNMERFKLELPALLSMNEESRNPRAAEFMISNICSGGAFFKTRSPLPVGTEVKMDVILPLDKFNKIEGNKSRVDVSGSVIRINEQGMAVRFDKSYRILPY